VALTVCSIAWTPRDEIWRKLVQEARRQFYDFGYSNYLIAGCAFLGAVSLFYQDMSNHWIFHHLV
jgi:hypothetical protein